MGRLTDRDDLLSAWRALAGSAGGAEGWSTIPLAPPRIRAGRHFPQNEEALLVGFASVHVPAAVQFPQGQGFLVTRVDLGADTDGRLWLALSRRTEGSLEMFTLMALDIILTLNASSATPEEHSFQLFLARIRAWQEFMRRGMDTTLSPEAEVGLFGELVFLRSIVEAGVAPVVVVESWLGPINGVQDFALGGGAVEVKTTIAATGFAATIGSLEQMDDSARQPLFLAAVRICLDASGMSLPEIIGATRVLFGDDVATRHSFNIKLLHAGYLDAACDHYRRRFALVCTRIFRVADGFPRLIRAGVPRHVLQARYELDIDGVDASTVAIRTALDQLGVM